MATDSNTRRMFADQLALVTGAASGIGRATAILLAQQGAAVIVADIDEAGATQTVQHITAEGGVGWVHALDVTSESAWQAALERVAQNGLPLRVVVNCAGIAATTPVADLPLAEWRRVLAINLDGTFLGTRVGIQALRRSGGGSIVNVASASGIKAAAGSSAYCASKAAVIMLTKVAALECNQNQDRIRINTVAPGGVKTPMWNSVALGSDITKSPAWTSPPDAPLGQRFAEPEEIARVIAFLASDAASYLTGSVLAADAGYTA